MIDMPPAPPPVAQVSYVTPQCVEEIAAHYNLPMALLVAVMQVEGGRVGQAVPNTNGTHDYGPMQVNSIWLPDLRQYGISEAALRNNGCVNVAAGGWILRQAIDNERSSIWRGIGAYHSRTPKFNQRYASKVKKALLQRINLFDVLARANGRKKVRG